MRDYLTVHLPRIRGLSAHTVASYGQSIRSFCVFLEEHREIKFSNMSFDHITRDSVNKYIQWPSYETMPGGNLQSQAVCSQVAAPVLCR